MLLNEEAQGNASDNDDNCSGYQSTDFQTAYEKDCISENDQSTFQEKINKMMAAEGAEILSANISRRGSFSITTASEMMNQEGQINCDINSAMNDELNSVINDQTSNFNDTASINPIQAKVT